MWGSGIPIAKGPIPKKFEQLRRADCFYIYEQHEKSEDELYEKRFDKS
jgi:hypothetical protein